MAEEYAPSISRVNIRINRRRDSAEVCSRPLSSSRFQFSSSSPAAKTVAPDLAFGIDRPGFHGSPAAATLAADTAGRFDRHGSPAAATTEARTAGRIDRHGSSAAATSEARTAGRIDHHGSLGSPATDSASTGDRHGSVYQDQPADHVDHAPSNLDRLPPRLEHRRSFSWGGSLPIFGPEDTDTASSHNVAQQPFLETASTEADSGEQIDSPPLDQLAVSPKHLSERNKLINKIRKGTDMRLDLEAVGKCGPDMDGDLELRQRKERMAECDKECSRILSFLFVGGTTVAQNLATLQDYRITHIINCVGFICPQYFPHEFEYKTLWLQDSPNEDIVCILYDVFDYIEKVREQPGGRVFVHCCQGVSRAPALAIAYLMWRKHACFEDAFHEVKSNRNVVSPNMGFVAQLMQWQGKVLDPPDRQAVHMYRIAPHCAYDPLYLVPKLVISHHLEALDSRGAFVIHMANRLYIWKGKYCDKEMVGIADRAGFQLIRYEHAQGPITLMSEGSEPCHILIKWKELLEIDIKSESLCRELKSGKANQKYDVDFEMYWKAKVGGYVPPLLGPGVVVHLPARDDRLSRIRASFVNSPRRQGSKF